MYNSWQKLGTINPQELTTSRLQLHYAIQFVAAVGAALVEPQPDDSHITLEWNPQLEALVGKVIPTKTPFQVALDPVTLTSLIIDDQGYKLLAFPLANKTMTQGLSWLTKELARLGVDPSKLVFINYPEDFPDHELAHGATFEARHEAERQELISYYINTTLLLQKILPEDAKISPIRIWPHHFDIATLITIPSNNYQEETTYIGVGMSPGDGNYNEPYWYVSPWPYPDVDNLPPLEGDGFWHTEGWIGAILTASQLISSQMVELQQAQVRAFLDSAIMASRILLVNFVSTAQE